MRNKIFIILVTVIVLLSFSLISCSNSETSKIGTNKEIQDTSTTQTTIPETTVSSKIETTTETKTTVLGTTTTKSEPTTTTKKEETTTTTKQATTTEQTTTTEEPTTTVQATTTTEQASTTETTTTTDNSGPFVGSVNSDVYHYPDCGSAKRIKEENRIWFSSSNEARAAGYRPCKTCNPPG
ncbi:MAG: Ada metal-binding domain-containing protein [Candidatus Humimicrobiaceae bacterium]